MTDDRLVFEDEKILSTSLAVKGAVADGGAAFRRHESLSIVGKARVDEVAFKDVKDVPTRLHTAVLTTAVIVDDDLAQDVLDEARERATGELRLLSPDGEMRHAARLALCTRRDRAFEEDETSDWLSSLDKPKPIVELATSTLKDLETRDPDKHYSAGVPDYDPVHHYLEDVRDTFAQAAALCLAGIEWARIHLEAHLEALDRARLEEIQRSAITADETGTAMTPDEVAHARGEDTTGGEA